MKWLRLCTVFIYWYTFLLKTKGHFSQSPIKIPDCYRQWVTSPTTHTLNKMHLVPTVWKAYTGALIILNPPPKRMKMLWELTCMSLDCIDLFYCTWWWDIQESHTERPVILSLWAKVQDGVLPSSTPPPPRKEEVACQNQHHQRQRQHNQREKLPA